MKELTEQIRIHDLKKCSPQDLEAITSLLITTRALIILVKQKHTASCIQSWIMHAFGIGNGILAINATYNDNTKFLALLYIPLILFFAHIGFQANNVSQTTKKELHDYQDKYKSLTDIIQHVTPQEIHDIAKIYRTEIPKNKEADITPDATLKAIQYILIKYQR